MPTRNDNDFNVQLAVYMERLDTYIASQTQLNETICERLEKIGEEVNELKHWRTRIYGAKSASVVLSLILLHSGMVLGSVYGMLNWFSNR